MEPTNEPDQEKLDDAKEDVKQKVTSLYESIMAFATSLGNVKSELDYSGAPKRVAEGIKFQGFNVWVLICSIFIASVGLNANSTAVIIGAMLISPLMGPIVGVGFSLGTNRFELLKRSFLNFVIMMVVALITSWLYFFLTPLDKADTEILARTSPTVLDVLIAVFGGLAGAIAGMRKESSITVVPGVAIATALMPPLCTVGYGIATWQPDFALGALYLFLLNSVIISLSTTVFVRMVRFPLHEFVDHKKERKAKIVIGIAMVLLVGPSVLFFVTATQKSIFESNAAKFVQQEVRQTNSFIISKNLNFRTDSLPQIEILFGGAPISDSVLNGWQEKMKDYDLNDCQLIINQDEHNEKLSDKIKALEQSSYENDRVTKTTLNAMIIENRIKLEVMDSLVSAIEMSHQNDSLTVDYEQVIQEMQAMFTGIKSVAYGEVTENKDGQLVDIPVIFVDWHKISTSYKNTQIRKLKKWIVVRCPNVAVQIKEYN